KRKADQGGGERSAEDDDGGMGVDEHTEVAAHHNERHQHDGAGEQAQAGCDIHETSPAPIRARLRADPRSAHRTNLPLPSLKDGYHRAAVAAQRGWVITLTSLTKWNLDRCSGSDVAVFLLEETQPGIDIAV